MNKIANDLPLTKDQIDDRKRRKISKHEKKERLTLQCEFFMPKKNRRCCMQRRADQKYCSEHQVNNNQTDLGDRVPCPFDNNHSVWSKNLENHLKKCNAKPKENQDSWYERDLNTKFGEDILDESSLKDDGDLDDVGLYKKYIPLLQAILADFKQLEFSICNHEGLKERMSEVTNQKHVTQQSSLIGNMKERGLLDINKFYLEFGCGKGELSRFVNLSILEDCQADLLEDDSKYGYGFIDRGVNRMKMDSKIIKEAQDKNVKILSKRSKIDIKDLNVDKFLEDINPKEVVVISKHLCGAATDLTLKLILNSSLLNSDAPRFNGLLIAMCCRHVCSYDQLLPQSRQYLKKKGFESESSFRILKKIVSWAVCGQRNGLNQENSNEHVSGLSFTEREELGLAGRRLIDESRVFAIDQLMGPLGYTVEMFWYVEKAVTLENVCLCIRPKS